MFYIFLPALDLYSGNYNAFHFQKHKGHTCFSRGILYFLRFLHSESELSILHYIQNSKLGDKNLGYFDRTLRFSSPEFSILHHIPNRKLRDENLKGRLIKLRRFLLQSFQLWVQCKNKNSEF